MSAVHILLFTQLGYKYDELSCSLQLPSAVRAVRISIIFIARFAYIYAYTYMHMYTLINIFLKLFFFIRDYINEATICGL